MMPDSAEQQVCPEEQEPHGQIGIVENAERLIRFLTDKDYKPNGDLKPNSFPLTDVRIRGLSLTRLDHVDLEELKLIAEDVRQLKNANETKGAKVGSAEAIRAIKASTSRIMCVIDDPVVSDPTARDNPAHAFARSHVQVSEEDARELRHCMLEIFKLINSFEEAYQS